MPESLEVITRDQLVTPGETESFSLAPPVESETFFDTPSANLNKTRTNNPDEAPPASLRQQDTIAPPNIYVSRTGRVVRKPLRYQ